LISVRITSNLRREMTSRAIVLDNGSGVMKVGLSGNNLPTGFFPTLIGRPEKAGLLPSMGQKDDYVGLEAFLKKGVLDLNYPMNHGIVTNWEDMERIWHHAFYYILRVPPEEHPLLLTEAPLNPRSNRELMAETMFETFYSPKLYVIIQPALALYSSGYTSGLVVDSGDGLTISVPFFEGSCIVPAMQRLEVGGRDISAYLSNLLSERGYSFSSSCSSSSASTAGFELVRELKENMLEFADTEANGSLSSQFMKHLEEETYTLPDGSQVKIGNERARAAEALFSPDLLGVESDGIHKMAHTSMMKCGVDIRKFLYGNILLSGGSTTSKGFVTRFRNSVTSLLPSTLSINVNAPHDRIHSVWIGGSILACLSTFQQMYISRKEYDEVGSSIVSKKCL